MNHVYQSTEIFLKKDKREENSVKSRSESVTKSRFEVNCDERFLIPEGVFHRYLNHCAVLTKIIFGIVPEL